jgi:hypothetical protein
MKTKGEMTHLRFQYFEVADRDYTAISIEIEQAGKSVACFRNWDSSAETKQIWGNQYEEFRLPSIQVALDFIKSAGCYHRVKV